MTEIIMLMGVAASGKSRIVGTKHAANGTVQLSRDIEGGRVSDLLPKMQRAISDGAPQIVLDCTFVKRADRAPFLAAAQAAKVPLHGHYIEIDPELAQFNACWRQCERYGHVLRPDEFRKAKDDPNMFPPPALFAMYKALEKPHESEGFHSLQTTKATRWKLPDGFENKAVIVDYDSTVRKTKSGDKYPRTVADVEVFPSAGIKLKKMASEGWLLLGASNQSGVAKNDPTREVAVQCFEETNRMLGVSIEYAFDDSPAGPVSSWHRKPMPGIGVDFIWKHKLNPALCVMIGDATSDKTFAQRCGFKFEWAKDFFELP